MNSTGYGIISTPSKDLHIWPAKVVSVLTGGDVDQDSTVSVSATLPSFDPDEIRSGKATPVLSEYLFPETSGCRLEAVDEIFIPRHTDNDGGLVASRTWLNDDTLDSLETWARFFDPSEILVHFTNPEHALDRMPTKVRVDLGEQGQTTCFFKAFGLGITGGPLNRELDVHKNIHASDLGGDVLVGRLVGIAHEHKQDSTAGLLLRYINHRGTLYDAVEDNPGLEMKEKWAAQIKQAVHELHRIGSVWGDAKPENILVDQDDNAWITDFEGGYTDGWVDPDKAGTMEGDLQGLERIIRFIFEGPQDNTWDSPSG
ncbi:hypothetical protein AK830_g3688 [Neonectria ditissima]|uniref:Protein kinase domain-containing protein n=1 Tax=Neonectria ditissima TaxID=78410 RepID=A0A0P7BHI0_9HYPO|nr:hypothetical protein AK830_g3688 [Neonectria ditissima]